MSAFAIVKHSVKSYNEIKIQLHAHRNILDSIQTKEKRLEYEARERAIRDHQYFSTVYKNTGLKEAEQEVEKYWK